MTEQREEMLIRRRLVAVLRAEDPEEVLAVGRACHAAGLDVLEVTLTVPDATAVLAQLRQDCPGAVVGAGTVLHRSEADRMLDAGADFLVSPALRLPVIAAGQAAGVPVVPGVATPTEMLAAHDAGCSLVKLFPAGALGVGTLQGFRQVASAVQVLPTGGIAPGDVPVWLAAGAAAVGIGSTLHTAYRAGGSEQVRSIVHRSLQEADRPPASSVQ